MRSHSNRPERSHDRQSRSSPHPPPRDAPIAHGGEATNPSGSDPTSDPPRRPRRSVAKVAGIIALAAIGLLTWPQPPKKAAVPDMGSVAQGPSEPTGAANTPLLIKHGWDIPNVTFAASNTASMTQMPFDGVVIRMDNGLSAAVQRQDPISYETFKKALFPLKHANLKHMKRNFLIVYSTPAGDIFDSWSTPLSNYENVARAAREVGFEGIFFDNEEYFGNALDRRDNCGGGRADYQCRVQASHQGHQVMNAICSGWPEARVLIAHGPYIGDDKTADHLNAHGMHFNDIAWANTIRGDFAVGMASATIGNSAQFIDGGEVYSARTPQNFKDLKHWQKEGFATQGSLVPDHLAPHWAANTSAAFGVYDSSPGVPPMEPDLWESTLTNALHATDRYVWAYTEKHDWWGIGHPGSSVPAAWVNATRRAREGSSTR